MNRTDLAERYDEILDRGCLSLEQRKQFREEGDLPGVLIQQSSGSSGEPPLRIPRTQAETHWLGAKLVQCYVGHCREAPLRTALLGGISHLQADQKVEIKAPLVLRNFVGDAFDEVDAFDPDMLSMYPSFAREIVADESLKLGSLKAIKLGGETIFRADLEKIWRRFPSIVVIEQFGSTEMPGVAFRTYTRDQDSGYLLSTDRFSFRFEDTDEWQPFLVRDNYPDRAFPIEGWFEMDDEVLVRNGVPVDVRRRGDAVFTLRAEINALLERGCVNVQLFPREAELLYQPEPDAAIPERVVVGGREFRTLRERPYRLVDSNKMPLLVDTAKLRRSLLYRRNADTSRVDPSSSGEAGEGP